MLSRPGGAGRQGASRLLLVLTIAVVAANLRPAITVVGPLIEQIGADTGLAPFSLGVLGAVPVLAFGVIAPFVHRISARWGLEPTVTVALLVLAIGTAARSLIPHEIALYLGTAVLSAAIGVGNVLVPAVVKRDFPEHVPTVTGLYTAALVGSAALFSAVAVPLAGVTGWRVALGAAAVLAVLAAGAWSLRTLPRRREHRPEERGEPGSDEHRPDEHSAEKRNAEKHRPQTRGPSEADAHPSELSAATMTDAEMPGPASRSSKQDAAAARVWRSALAWQVTGYFGLQSGLFYLLLTWLPAVQTSHGADQTNAGLWLGAFQAVGIIASLVIGRILQRTSDQRAVSLVVSAFMMVGLLGMIAAPALLPLWVLCAGISTGSALLLALTFISLRARTPAQVGELSGMAQGVGYLFAAAGPVLAGGLYQLSGSWLPVLWCALGLAGVQAVMGLLAGRSAKLV